MLGTTRTLDGAKGDKTKEPIEPGLVSREGWVLVDDSARPVFDSDNFNFSQGEQAPWPWVTKRAEGDRQDWYFFGYGHDYKKALGDYREGCWTHPDSATLCFRHLVVAILGL